MFVAPGKATLGKVRHIPIGETAMGRRKRLHGLSIVTGLALIAAGIAARGAPGDPQEPPNPPRRPAQQDPLKKSIRGALNDSLVGSEFRPGLLGMVAGVPTYQLSDLLANSAARTVLKPTADQDKQIEVINADARASKARFHLMVDKLRQTTPEEREQIREELQASGPLQQQHLFKLLDVRQQALARSILFRLNGELSFAYPKLAEEFQITEKQLEQMQSIATIAIAQQRQAAPRPQPKLTEEQQAALKEIQQEQSRRIRERQREGVDPNQPDQDRDLYEARLKIIPPLTDEAIAERIHEIDLRRKTVCERLRVVLTDEQKLQWSALPAPAVEPGVMEAIKREFDLQRYRPQAGVTTTR